MQPKIVYWEIKDHLETGFNLLEISEDGVLNKRSFLNQGGDYRDQCFKESECISRPINGRIVIEKANFGSKGQLKASEIEQYIEVHSIYEFSQYKKARELLNDLHHTSKESFNIDFRLVLKLDDLSLLEETSHLNRDSFIITDFRVVSDNHFLVRKEPRELFAIEFIPVLNEKVYFQYIPESRHFLVTGDNLFALETRVIKKDLSDLDFLNAVHQMKNHIENHEDSYRKLINNQRLRRAMLETEIIGDLYPR